MDPEDLQEVIAAYHACIADVVRSYDGFVAQYLGDGALIYFGYPRAHDNDAERAVGAALSIVDYLAKLKPHGQQLDVRVGIATGPVVVGEIIGVGQMLEKGAIGETPNLAARMQTLAEINTIVIASSTRRLTGRLFEYRDLGYHELKGFAEPVQAWLVLGSRAHDSRFETLSSGDGPFIGRRLELEYLRAILDACRETGQGRAVYVRGEAGIGKSRLLGQFVSLARQKGFSCHTALVFDFGGGAGRDAVRTITCDTLGLSRGSSAAAVLSVADAQADGLVEPNEAMFLNDLLDIPQPKELRAIYDAMDNKTRTAGTCRTIARLVEVACRLRLRIFAVEDIHWADPWTLSHLAALASAAANCSAVLVMTSRSDQDPLDRAWRATAGSTPLVTIDLGPLSQNEASILATSFLGERKELADRCIERASGNPFFLEQLARNVAEGAETIPDSVQSLVQARLDRLDPADKLALQAASVLGQRFDRGALAHLVEEQHYAAERLLEPLMVEAQGDDFHFSHALIRDAIYDGLLKSRRRELHRRAAEWYAQRDATAKAEHLDRAGDPGAARAYVEAAQVLVTKNRNATARQLVERGLRLATGQQDRFALSCLHGEITHDLGDMPAALDAFEKASTTASNTQNAVVPGLDAHR